MTSGVTCNPECIDAFNEMKLRKKYRYIIYYIKDEKTIEIGEKGERDTNYEQFQQALYDAQNSGEGRYAVYDYEPEPKNCNLVFFVWTPSTIGVRSKMIYASSKDAIKKKLVGIKKFIEANDVDEIDESEVRGCL